MWFLVSSFFMPPPPTKKKRAREKLWKAAGGAMGYAVCCMLWGFVFVFCVFAVAMLVSSRSSRFSVVSNKRSTAVLEISN